MSFLILTIFQEAMCLKCTELVTIAATRKSSHATRSSSIGASSMPLTGSGAFQRRIHDCSDCMFSQIRPHKFKNLSHYEKHFWGTVRPILWVLSVLSVCNVGILWPNGWMDQDATWYRGRPRPRRHCVRWRL